jgi:hypothetical protein
VVVVVVVVAAVVVVWAVQRSLRRSPPDPGSEFSLTRVLSTVQENTDTLVTVAYVTTTLLQLPLLLPLYHQKKLFRQSFECICSALVV